MAATTPGAWCELMHMYALSSTINVEIRSFVPPVRGLTLVENPYNVLVVGAGTGHPKVQTICIM